MDYDSWRNRVLRHDHSPSNNHSNPSSDIELALPQQLRQERREGIGVAAESQVVGVNPVHGAVAVHAEEDLAGAERQARRTGNILLGTDGDGTVDGVHPNDLGFRRHADALAPVLTKLLRKR